jgi:hypothetical protein
MISFIIYDEAKKLLHNSVIHFYAQFRTVHEDCTTLEDGTERLSQDVGTEISFYAE